MPDCSYCEEQFDDETAYRRHLKSAHEEELSRIDRRRVGNLDGNDDQFTVPTWVILVGAGVCVVAIGAAVVLGTGGGSSVESLPDRGDPQRLQAVEQFDSQGREHVTAGTPVNYSTYPPTSGSHYDGTVSAGFYNEAQSLGNTVHTLEHGAVVIYYDPAALTPDAREHLEALAATHTGHWKSVVVMPHPRGNAEHSYVLTAWRHRLQLETYDRDTVRAFLAEYLGRGPENPVR